MKTLTGPRVLSRYGKIPVSMNENHSPDERDVPKLSDEELAEDLSALGEKLLQVGRALSSGHAAPGTRHAALDVRSNFSDGVIAAIALSIHRARRRRARYLNNDLLGEPAWDILLDLFVNMVRGTRVSSTSLCHAAGVPTTTATRAIRRLEAEGLVRRHSAPDDKRLTLVELTSTGYKLMRSYICDGVLKDEMPLPEGVTRN